MGSLNKSIGMCLPNAKTESQTISTRIQELTNRYYHGLEILQALDKPKTVDELGTELGLDIDEVRDRVAYLAEFDRVRQEGESVSPVE